MDNSLEIDVRDIEFTHDVLDTNAINFLTADGYFSIQRGVCVDPDDDPRLNLPFMELNSQEGADARNLKSIEFHRNEIRLLFEGNFIGKHPSATLKLPGGVERRVIDFFVNHLFLGDIIGYAEDIDPSWRVKQTNFQDVL